MLKSKSPRSGFIVAILFCSMVSTVSTAAEVFEISTNSPENESHCSWYESLYDQMGSLVPYVENLRSQAAATVNNFLIQPAWNNPVASAMIAALVLANIWQFRKGIGLAAAHDDLQDIIEKIAQEAPHLVPERLGGNLQVASLDLP